jgi:uncharacterized protein (DUF885 family)
LVRDDAKVNLSAQRAPHSFPLPRRRAIGVITCVALSFGTGSCGRPDDAGSAPKQLHTLFEEEWAYEMKTNPETATIYGDNRYNSELSDYSPDAFRRDIERKRGFLRRFEGADPRGLSAEDGLSRSLMIRRLRDQIRGAVFKPWEMPVDQMNGVHLQLAQLPGYTRFETVKDYEDYLSRLSKLPKAFQQIEEDMRLGLADHLMPPAYLLDKVATQAQQISDARREKSPFTIPLTKFPNSIPKADQDALRTRVFKAIEESVSPAYRQFGEFVRKEYAPRGRVEPGVWSLPDGEARYHEAVRVLTTTSLTPEQIHDIGQKQVVEIEKQMLALANSKGFKDLASFNASIKSNKALYAKSGDQILSLYRGYINQMRPEMNKLFTRQPKVALEVIPMEEFRARDAVPADYSPGTTDGKRPGRVNVNEWDPEHRLTLNIEAIAYHEGIPGHHQQIGLQQEVEGVPEFRKHAEYTAFVEGWALYSERLGKEVGFYKDAYSEYGRLENEMWRAVRLVVDTGVHYKRWNRQQMIDFFRAHTAMDEPNIQSEADRYIAWPGQALAYKIGQMKILELRERARQVLGERLDLRAFHDALLGNGALPLEVLETRIQSWIDKAKRQ